MTARNTRMAIYFLSNTTVLSKISPGNLSAFHTTTELSTLQEANQLSFPDQAKSKISVEKKDEYKVLLGYCIIHINRTCTGNL